MRATPGRFSSALTTIWSVSEVSSRSSLVFDITASDTTGCWFSFSMRITSGSFTSRGNDGRIKASLSRTSWIGLRHVRVEAELGEHLEVPSSELLRISLTPEIWLRAYSIGLVTSVSTASGAAPG